MWKSPRSVDIQYATWKQQRNSSRKNEETTPKEKHPLVVRVSGGESKVWCCKEQYCIGTWNVKSVNQGKLSIVNQEMARLNINILGISELKWTGLGNFNSDDHYIHYSGQKSFRGRRALIVNKRVWNTAFRYDIKDERFITVCIQGKPFNSMAI